MLNAGTFFLNLRGEVFDVNYFITGFKNPTTCFFSESKRETLNMKAIFVVIIMTTVLLSACSKNSSVLSAVDCTSAKSFASDVQPIFQTYCATNSSCHGSGSLNGPGTLNTYSQIYNARSTIRVAVANRSMPQNATLSTTQINGILCWIDNGASNN